jgi:DNA repair photolyase
MIISVSRRTDIPPLYSQWFFNRIKEKFVYVRNPVNSRQISKISLSPEIIDCIVFWSKNPKPMLDSLKKLSDYQFYFQFTINSYSRDIEINMPSKKEIIETFKKLSDTIGPEKVIWRYDPILLNDTYNISSHTENFNKIARQLAGFTKKVTFSFIDFYKKLDSNFINLNIKEPTLEDKYTIAENISLIAKENGMETDTCAEDIDLSRFDITRARCIDDRLIERITGHKLDISKDKYQRPECGCVKSTDIGAYNSCSNGCMYCYANHNQYNVEKNRGLHNPLSSLLIGEYTGEET